MVDRARPKRGPVKPPAPAVLKESIAKARARTLTRRHGPPIFIKRDDEGNAKWEWPFDDGDGPDQEWRFLLVDAFGTRQESVALAFLEHLTDLCATTFDDEWKKWVPDEGQIIMLLHIVNAHQPKNEAQAALAAAIAATHMLMMKVGKRVADYTHDTKMIGAYANLARASASQIEAMATLKGRKRSTSQKITVRHEKHIHNHQHVHIEGGASDNDRQPEASMGSRTDKNADGSPALPSSEETGRVVPIDGRKGKAGLPGSWGRSGGQR